MLALTAVVAAFYWPPVPSLVAGVCSAFSFHAAFLAHHGSAGFDLRQHALLMALMVLTMCAVPVLVARRLRKEVAVSIVATRAEQLRAFGEALRDTDDPRSQVETMRDLLSDLAGAPSILLILTGPLREHNDPEAVAQFGHPSPDQEAGLWLTLRHSMAMGPGTGRHEEQPAWYLPMRGRRSSFGAALLPLPKEPMADEKLRLHAQALCDQMGVALERAAAMRAAATAREEAQAEHLRNTLLAAISHDYRTPLATISGAASSLHDQAEKLSVQQMQRLAATIVDEAGQLSRMTDNTLQLARLDSPGFALEMEWESIEEIVGSLLRRLRQRDPARRLTARLEPNLPLLRCNAVLIIQLLDNLVDNALKYGGDKAPIEVVVRRLPEAILIAVSDRGPGIEAAWRERIFHVFQRAERPQEPAFLSDRPVDAPTRRGAGVGLAVCRAIARAHGGTLALRGRQRGGSSFECSLPLGSPPAEVAGWESAP